MNQTLLPALVSLIGFMAAGSAHAADPDKPVEPAKAKSFRLVASFDPTKKAVEKRIFEVLNKEKLLGVAAGSRGFSVSVPEEQAAAARRVLGKAILDEKLDFLLMAHYEVPAGLKIVRQGDRLDISPDMSKTEPAFGALNPGLITGVKYELKVLAGDKVVSSDRGGLMSDTTDFGTTIFHRATDKIPAPGEKYTVVLEYTAFETDVPVASKWAPQSSDKYKILFVRTIKQTEE